MLTITVNGVETLRMDMLTFQNNTTHPLVSPLPNQKYNVRLYGGGTTHPTLAAGSRLMYSESFA